MSIKIICAEYIWIDAFDNLRSKLKVIEIVKSNNNDIYILPEWNFDGSSTGQSIGKLSDVILKPVSYYNNPFITWCDSILVLCECYTKDDLPHETNNRIKCIETFNKCINEDSLFGIEQEYFIFGKDNLPYKWKNYLDPGCGSQGPYYCGIGGDRSFGREISNKHLELCIKAGLKIGGTNSEVVASQWEYQIGPLNAIEVSDQLWISRYILQRVSEDYDCYISFHPKPLKGDWNGSGGHTNFSTKKMREENGLVEIEKACVKLSTKHNEHIKIYGKYNDERLSGLHETSSMNDFSWGVSDRGKSIRIPLNVYKSNCGYLEDRRPASNLDPYLVTEIIMNTVILQ